MVDTPGTGSDAPDEKRAAPGTSGTAESPSQSAGQASEQAAAPTGAPAAPAAPAAPPADAPAAAPAPDTRPRPEFGEYAPEGWEWTPEDDAATTAAAPNAAAIRPGGPAARAGGATPGNVQGVPHNLGAGTALPSRKGATQGGSGTPYRAPAPGQPGTPTQPGAPTKPAQYRAPAQGSVATQQLPARTGDRIVTILLLVLGGFGALQSAFAMMGMSTMFVFLEDAPGITELSPPAWIDGTGKAVGIALLVLYGLVLVYSIRRLRARKLTFWAPLAAGVLSVIVVVAIIAGAMIGTPELMELMRDPQSSAELLEYLRGIQAG